MPDALKNSRKNIRRSTTFCTTSKQLVLPQSDSTSLIRCIGAISKDALGRKLQLTSVLENDRWRFQRACSRITAGGKRNGIFKRMAVPEWTRGIENSFWDHVCFSWNKFLKARTRRSFLFLEIWILKFGCVLYHERKRAQFTTAFNRVQRRGVNWKFESHVEINLVMANNTNLLRRWHNLRGGSLICKWDMGIVQRVRKAVNNTVEHAGDEWITWW